MTEAEFMSLAKIGVASESRRAIDGQTVFPVLIEFLHSNGFHDMGRVMESVFAQFIAAKANQMPFGV